MIPTTAQSTSDNRKNGRLRQKKRRCAEPVQSSSSFEIHNSIHSSNLQNSVNVSFPSEFTLADQASGSRMTPRVTGNIDERPKQHRKENPTENTIPLCATDGFQLEVGSAPARVVDVNFSGNTEGTSTPNLNLTPQLPPQLPSFFFFFFFLGSMKGEPYIGPYI